MLASDWSLVNNDKVPPYWVFAQPIQKSEQDDREYRLIRLENGLHAMLIHDAKADKAAASLDVAVGHMSDPDDMPGLAHFCEHLSFMGTEQYPRENEYSEFLAKNNGSSNAFTAAANTNYFFCVATPALIPALSRFAAFFHSPLFSPSCTTRELNAVNSEHKKNLQSDMWRIFQLNKHLSAVGHPWGKFGSGNKESLSKAGKDLKASNSIASSPAISRKGSPAPSVKSAISTNSEGDEDGGFVGRETRRRLVEWWSREYCAGRMRLCVIGQESLKELADTTSTLFSPVQNRGQDPVPMINEHPFGLRERGTIVSVQTIMSFHAVEISFPLAYQPPFWRHKPVNFVGHFVGHEGPGSLHSYLKGKGWLTNLSAGAQNLGRGFAMFKITIHLTDEGFLNYRSVILAAFKYLSLLRSSAFPEWYQRERVALAGIRFRFLEKRRPEDYAVWVSEHMIWPVPPDLHISAPQMIWDWDDEGEKEVRDLIDGLRVDLGRAVVMATASEHEKILGSVSWETEPRYGSKYRVERFDEELVKEARGPNDISELFLPGPNEFIPTNLDVDKKEVAEPLRRPLLIRKSPLSDLWHKKDDKFWVPKAYIKIHVLSPMTAASPRNVVLTRLFHDLVTDSLTEYSYNADLAGLNYAVGATDRGLQIYLSGYNDKLPVLARRVVERLRDLTIKPERMEVMKQMLAKDLHNFFLSPPYALADYYALYLAAEQQWPIEEVLPEIPSVTAEELRKHANDLLSNVYMPMLVAGNITQKDAVDIAEMVEKTLRVSALPSDSPLRDRALILPQGCNYVWTRRTPNPAEANSALSYYIHVGRLTDPSTRITMALTAQILSEPAFNILRTKEQLGYVVMSSVRTLAGGGVGGIRILIQSERNPIYLERRVDAFLEHMETVIESMSAQQFEEQKFGLERKWREGPKQLGEEVEKYWTQIDDGYLDFYRREQDAELLKNITKQDIYSFFLLRILPSSPTRSKLSVHMQSQKTQPPRMSAAAIDAFESLLERPELRGRWKEELTDDTPVVSEFATYWREQDIGPDILAAIPELVAKYPCEALMEGVTQIEDVMAFKKSLEISEAAQPLVEWGDSPLSKY